MTVIATKGGDYTVRDAQVGAILAAEGMLRGGAGSIAVTGKSMGGIPAADLAIRIASQAVAKRKRICVWRGDPPDRARVTGTWQARFFAGAPNERDPWFLVFEQTEASLTARNNAYWRKVADERGQIVAVYVVHPDAVQTRWNREKSRPEYRVMQENGGNGGWSDWLTSADILHFRVGYQEPGAIVAPSPVQRFREALSAALAKYRYEWNLFEKGLIQSIGVTFPADVKPEQARRFREMVESRDGGIDNSAGVRVFGGGATVAPIGLSPADAQFVEGMNFDVYQTARIFGVTASLLETTGAVGARTVIPPEQEEDRWWRFGLEPRLCRIEEFVSLDTSFFGPRARDYPEFASQRLRADRATEVANVVALKQSGIITANTGAAELGYPGLGPEGDVLQITPVGGAPNEPAPTSQENA